MNYGIIVQARMGSTRLPGKILREFHGGMTLLETLLGRLGALEGAALAVATSDMPSDDVLADFLQERGIPCFRGSEDDVLGRFIGTARAFGFDGLVRVCSDNPFLDPKGVKTLLASAALHPSADYIGFRVGGKPSIKTHFGFWGEYVTLSALEKISATTDSKEAHEHVTIHAYTHQEEYRCEWIDVPAFLRDRSDIRLTVDTGEDFRNASMVYDELSARNPAFGLRDVVDYIDSHPHLLSSMSAIIASNKK